ncbi:MAG: HEAT repeat domain-containing protein [Planctomycetia bacterium]|nr:HEAT repeat domain-containing protein [Planctomycetia bacterium]
MPYRILIVLPALVVLGLLLGGASAPAADDPAVTADEELLKAAGVGNDPADLLAYLRRQVAGEDSRREIDTLVMQLGSDQFATRTEAAKKLTALGWAAMPRLREAAKSADPEIRTRAQQCLNDIEKTPGPTVISAVVRLLVQRKPAEALPLLLDYSASVPDEGVEDEVLTGLGALGVRQGKVDPLLEAAARDKLAPRRAVAACVLGRSGLPDQRETVRKLLVDPDAKVRRYAMHGLLGGRFSRTPDDGSTADDEALLQKEALGSDAAALLGFLKRRTLREADLQQIKTLIKQLDSDKFKEREDATQRLVEFGAGALASLREAMKGSALEVSRRAEICVERITASPGPALPASVVRLLVRRPAPEALAVLLDYLPFADDAVVEDEVLTALGALAVRETQVDPALTTALADKHAGKRAAAALVLARVGTAEHCAAVRALLKDESPRVRLRAAQGLLSVRDKPAVEVLVGLIGEGDVEYASVAEGLLQQVAAERAPGASLGDGAAEARKKCHEAWLAWWQEAGPTLELRNLEEGGRYFGLTLVSELVGNNGTGNRIWEFGRDGKSRWEMPNLQGPIDAQVLPGGRVLVAEHNSQMVTERDMKGQTVWKYKVTGNPVACQRLPNGNTFIATYNAVMEVTPQGQQVYQHNPNAGVGGVIYDASKLPNGNIVCISGRGTVLELDAAGKKVTTIQLNNNGGWGGVSPLPNGRFLVAIMNPGKVLEVDRTGKVHWEVPVRDACHAVRLPNGNTVVACMNIQKVMEVNRAGQTVHEFATTGRPFHVRPR